MKNVPPALDKRKAYILATVVYEYIATAEPVGSNTLAQKYSLGVSSATIRNEMAELEAGGYLVAPHTSSGRVPTDLGYRTYVDQLMRPETLAADEQRRIREEFRIASRKLDEAIEVTTRLLGQLSKNVAFVVAPQSDSQLFRHIQLIWLSERTILAIIVTSTGNALQSVFDVDSRIDADDLTRASNRLNATLAGKTLREIVTLDVAAMVRELDLPAEIAAAVERAFRSAISNDEPALTSSGAQHLLDQPEFHDLRKLRAILRIVEEHKTLYDLVADRVPADGPRVKIGGELGSDEITECSLVTVPYHFGEEIGLLAILGPRRMPYARLLALAAGTAQSLSAHLADPQSR